ncbi:MAG: alpha/beta fold hydrolase [Pseudomonadales bacterium]|jgi:pimeloyl-ACP methyl ester carboxylesterase|nr:alpha/beta fold hydrolase [Pseudomonadales bacterium]
MPSFEQGDLHLEYEIHGDGAPVLLFAPGGMRSARALWTRATFDPRDVLADRWRLIAMDQRNAGRSRAPVAADDGWHSYAADHLALLDHLGIERCHLLGMCIGGSFALRLIQSAPDRIASAVLLQPIGAEGNRDAFREMFDGWARELVAERADVTADALEQLRANMFDGDFVFSVDRAFVAGCGVPLLVLRGDDLYHPASVSEEIVRLAPHASLIRDWKEGVAVPAAVDRIRAFLAETA